MNKIVKICGKDYKLKSSFLTIEQFYIEFGDDFGETLGKVQDDLLSLKDIKDNQTKYFKTLSSIISECSKLAYVMIKEADGFEGTPTYREWASTLTNAFEDMQWLGDVVRVGTSVFRRALSEQEQ